MVECKSDGREMCSIIEDNNETIGVVIIVESTNGIVSMVETEGISCHKLCELDEVLMFTVPTF